MDRYIKTEILAKIIFDKWKEFDELKQIIPDIQKAVMCESTFDLVPKERYSNLLANSIIVCEELKKYQSEDMVQVVRCKDCRFWKTETAPIGIECEPGETAHYCEHDNMIWRSGDFCKYGDRREYGTHGHLQRDRGSEDQG